MRRRETDEDWQPRPQGFSLKKWVGKALGTRLEDWNPAPGIRNKRREIQNIKMSWAQ